MIIKAVYFDDEMVNDIFLGKSVISAKKPDMTAEEPTKSKIKIFKDDFVIIRLVVM